MCISLLDLLTKLIIQEHVCCEQTNGDSETTIKSRNWGSRYKETSAPYPIGGWKCNQPIDRQTNQQTEMGVNWEVTFPITWQSQGWIKSWNFLWLNSVLNVTKKYSTRVEYERTNNMMSITVPSPDSHIPGPNSSPIFQFKFPSLASSGGLRNVYRKPPISGYPESRGENLKKKTGK